MKKAIRGMREFFQVIGYCIGILWETSRKSVPVFNGVNSQECDQMYEILIEKLMPKDVRAVI